MQRIAIDPGMSGAIAWDTGTLPVQVANMPSTLRDILDLLEGIAGGRELDTRIVIEKVGWYMPGNSGPAAVKFARHCGALEMALISLRVPFDQVLPSKWEHLVIGKPAYAKIPPEIKGNARKKILSDRKRDRKNRIKARMQEVYPHLKVTLVNADALAMLYFMTQTNC